jgi:hypothetical protein
MKSLFGYLVAVVIAPLVGYFVGKHTTPAVGAAVAGGVATVGARVLHLQDPPAEQ